MSIRPATVCSRWPAGAKGLRKKQSAKRFARRSRAKNKQKRETTMTTEMEELDRQIEKVEKNVLRYKKELDAAKAKLERLKNEKRKNQETET